jgi:hypothetical protein
VLMLIIGERWGSILHLYPTPYPGRVFVAQHRDVTACVP